MQTKIRLTIPLIFLVLVILFLSSNCRYVFSPLQSDSVMLTNFNTKKEKFARLLEMSKEDKQSSKFTLKGELKLDNVSNERNEEYKKILKELKIRNFSVSLEKGESYQFYFSDADKTVDDICFLIEKKFYIWMEEKPSNIVGNLDWQRIYNKNMIAYRHIENNWYLVYARDGSCKD